MRAPDSNEKGAPHTESLIDVATAHESSQYVHADARTPLHLPSGTADAVHQGGFPGARARLHRGVVAGVATTTGGADPTGCSKICHV